ncbi:alpha/beta hydrolase [Secundilactobacillus hailunensis]|uniref:Alpha/beta hydrolase n=1 Tax=Secundilactobacillus hailunensis TaxID=2559923 RepID=A0ABW1T8E1_9LACO
MATIICPNCGKSIPKGSATCPNCGYQLTQIKVPHSSQKSIKKQIQVRGSNWFAHFKQAGYFLLKGKWLTAFLSLFLICLVGYLFQQYQLYQREFRIQQQLTQATNSLKHQSQIMAKQQPPIQEHLRKIPQDPKQPILVLHGFGGSYNSERYLVASLEQTHLAKQQLMVDVDRHSHIHLIGKYRPTVTHKVIIPIVIENNRAGEFYYSAMLAKIMPKLNHRYHIKKYDAIGHSAFQWYLEST